MNIVNLTHCGKLGDMLYSLPIASWLHKTRGVMIRMVLPECFPPFRDVTSLLMAQPFIEDVALVGHQCNWSGHAGQPYKFNPSKYGIEGEYYNLGFRGYPNKFVSTYIAEEYGLGWDKDFTLNLGEELPGTDEILRSEQPEIAAAVPHSTQFSVPTDLLALGQRLRAAKERHLWYSGPASMMFLARIPFHLHYVAGHPQRHLYLPENVFGGNLIKPVFCNGPSRP